jgi:hypothetical protein
MLLIFSPRTSNRLQYILQLLLCDQLGINYKLTTNYEEFDSSYQPKLNYSQQQRGEEIFIHAEELLFERLISPQQLNIRIWNHLTIIFANDYRSALPFDPFAASFFLVSRYEEYLPFNEDAHGRFPAEQSISYIHHFHDIPLVDHYAILLKKVILSRYPDFFFPEKKYRFQLTYDIDMVFAFLENGIFRNAGGYLKSLMRLQLKEIYFRTKVLLRVASDPFDTFEYQNWLNNKYSLHPIYFFLVANHGIYDKNISWRNRNFSAIVRMISESNGIGLHASYDSNQNHEKVKVEIKRLEDMSGKKIIRNRQHFLKLRFPETYRNLIASGITEDHTMGYSSLAGFRAGTTSSFKFYDLEKEQATPLVIHPFAVMDATLHYHLKLSTDAALEVSKKIILSVKKVNGTFTFLAHNDLISDKGPWAGWRKKFEQLIEFANN